MFSCGWRLPVWPLPCSCALLLDHLIRQDEEGRGERDPECLRRLAIEDQLELRGLLHGELRGLGALQQLIDIDRSAPPHVPQARPVDTHGLTPVALAKYSAQEICSGCAMSKVLT